MHNKTKIAGVICEFNPLHMGHKYFLDQIKASGCGGIIAVMSGNYVQRGEPAIIDKYQRTKAALSAGVDLVLELPVPYSCSGAEKFSMAAVEILNSTGLCDELWFGTECGDIKALKKISEFLISEKSQESIKSAVNGNTNFASARQKICESVFGKEYADFLSDSNNILGIEYIKALLITESHIVPKTVCRKGAEHDSLSESTYPSASFIRKQMLDRKNIDKYVPESVYLLIGDSPLNLANIKNCERAIIYAIREMNIDELSEIYDVSEGLEYRIKEAANKAKSIEELYTLIKSKRYSHARIRRIILHAFLGIKKSDYSLPHFTRVLGMNRVGEEILRNMSDKITLVSGVSSKYSDSPALSSNIVLSEKCDEKYGLFCDEIRPVSSAYQNKIIK